MSVFLRKLKYYKIRLIISVTCCVIFLGLEQPSVVSKIIEQLSNFSVYKIPALIFLEFATFVCIMIFAFSFSVVKWLSFFFISLSILVFDSYYRIMGWDLQYEAFFLLIKSRNNILDVLFMYWQVICLSLLKIFFLFCCFFAISKEISSILEKKWFSLCGILLFLFLSILVWISCIFRETGSTDKFPSALKLSGLIITYYYDMLTCPYTYQYGLGDKKIKVVNNSSYRNIILVIDESVRWDFSPFSRINQIKTKDNQSWQIFDYGYATSYANVSATSNIALRKGLRFENIARDFYDNSLIWDYAKHAGFTTILYDNQYCGVGHDYFDNKELKMIDVNICQKDNDKEIWRYLEKYITFNKSPVFAIIIKKGSHFPYSNNFPTGYQSNVKVNQYIEQRQIRKDYLDSIVYQSDDFWKAFEQLYVNNPTLIIYTSDHGQNLEDVPGPSHGTDKNPYFGEGIVPIVVLSNIKNSLFDKNFLYNKNKVSHFNIFPTLLEAMGYNVTLLKGGGVYRKEFSSYYQK